MNDTPGWQCAQGDEACLRDAAGAVLLRAAHGDAHGAGQALERLFALRGRFHAYPILQDMLAGRRAWQPAGSVYVLGEQPPPAALLRNFDEAVAACASFLGLPPPCILLQCVPASRDMHLTMESFPGLAMVRLSTQSDGFAEGLRAVVFHEVAHCFLTSGVRLLDEGLAQLFANRFGGAQPLPPRPELVPPLRTLLTRDGDVMFGGAADGTIDAYRAACRAGADVLEQVDARGGAAAIVDLFRAVARASSDTQLAQLVEEASGQSFATHAMAPAPEAALALVQQVREAIFAAWSSQDTDQLAQAIAALEAEPVFAQPMLLDALLSARLNCALMQVHAGVKLPAGQEAHFDGLLKAAEILPPGRLWLWRGVRAILAILLARPNIIKVAAAGQAALHAFGKADELIAGDPDLLIHHASLLLHAPPNYGGDRDLGADKLRQAMAFPLYRAHARQMLLDNGIDPGDELPETRNDAPADNAAAVRAGALANAALALDARGLELRLKSGFLLQPGDFSVRQGERVAIVGRNGSGKTMLLEVLLGLRKPERGVVMLASGDPADAKARQKLGGLLQGADLPGQMRVSEIMTLHETIYTRTDAGVTRALGMQELRDRLWQQLSRGQKQRVMLWLALSHVPELVLLDEPSLGLDEWYARSLRELLARLPVTLLQISHAPADLQGMDRILCMDGGRIVDSGTLADMVRARVGSFRARIGPGLAEQAAQSIGALPGLVQAVQADGGWLLHGGAGFDQAFRRFVGQNDVAVFSLESATVEDFLADLAKGERP